MKFPLLSREPESAPWQTWQRWKEEGQKAQRQLEDSGLQELIRRNGLVVDEMHTAEPFSPPGYCNQGDHSQVHINVLRVEREQPFHGTTLLNGIGVTVHHDGKITFHGARGLIPLNRSVSPRQQERDNDILGRELLAMLKHPSIFVGK